MKTSTILAIIGAAFFAQAMPVPGDDSVDDTVPSSLGTYGYGDGISPPPPGYGGEWPPTQFPPDSPFNNTPVAAYGAQCSSTQVVSCCEGGENNGLGLLDVILGGTCGGILSSSCSQGPVTCCEAAPQSGLINVGAPCIPISL